MGPRLDPDFAPRGNSSTTRWEGEECVRRIGLDDLEFIDAAMAEIDAAMTYMHHGIAGKWFVARTYSDEERRVYLELELSTSFAGPDDPVLDDVEPKLVFRSTEQIEDLAVVLSKAKNALKEMTDKGYRPEAGGIERLLSNRY